MRIAVCPGSYDPITNGHVNIIERSARLFDKIIVLVSVNTSKQTLFSVEERAELVCLATRHIPNVEVDAFSGLLSEYARSKHAMALVKGLRATSDFEYEFQMAQINKSLNPKLETLLINSDARYTYISSSVVKELARMGGAFHDFVPKEVEKRLLERLAGQEGPPAQKGVVHLARTG